MASASKCDICKKFYDTDEGMGIELWEGAIHGVADMKYELCPNHKNMLLRLLNGNETVTFYETKEN